MQRALSQGRFEAKTVFQRLQETIFKESSFDAYVIDDTGFAKQGKHSVGVQRQYSGTLGKIGNCQIAVTLHASTDARSCIIDAQLYVPKIWSDADMRKSGRIPDDVIFQTKPEIALALLQNAIDAGAPKYPVLADAAYGDNRQFRERILAMGLDFAVGISSKTRVWRPGSVLAIPERTSATGRSPSKFKDINGTEPVLISVIAQELWDTHQFANVVWREGSRGRLNGEFVSVRIQSAENEHEHEEPSKPMWLLIERDPGRSSDFKYYFLSFDENTTIEKMVSAVKLRWRVEYDYREMKQYLGMDTYEGRYWGGFHRHLAMVSLMHAFISLHSEAFSP